MGERIALTEEGDLLQEGLVHLSFPDCVAHDDVPVCVAVQSPQLAGGARLRGVHVRGSEQAQVASVVLVGACMRGCLMCE